MFSCSNSCPTCTLSNPQAAACCTCAYRGSLTLTGDGKSSKTAKCERAKVSVKFNGGTPARMNCKGYHRGGGVE